ncbi:MAG TPA: T9SS type A sorting domain-containing protein [Saprospiraceae bacterium]|nr:T9SS type A sorting domain-containing protein [Saprospiraceae bacterium]
MKNAFLLILSTCLLFPFVATGQSFSLHSNSPFGIQFVKPDTTRAAQKIMFADYDHDGDLDLFLTGLDRLDAFEDLQWEEIHFFIEMQENIGDRSHPQFGPRKEITNNFPYPVGYFMPAVGDINGDHKTDLIISSAIDQIGNGTPLYLKNIGSSGANAFEVLRFDEMEIPSFVPQSMFIPELADLDGDGDLDVLMSGFDPAFHEENGPDVPVFRYARNVSNPSVEPDFEGWYSNPYGLVPHPNIETLIAGDIDNDGDEDLLGSLLNLESDSISRLYLHMNIPGPDSKPNFSTVLLSPFGMPTANGGTQLTSPALADLDGDGDLDLFVFINDGSTPVLAYYLNNICQPASQDDLTLIGHTLFTDQTGPGFTYQWLNCDSGENIAGETNVSFTPMVNGNYGVVITSDQGCTIESECISVIINGIADPVLSNSILVYPNPSYGWLTIQNDSGLTISDITITNLSGQIQRIIQLKNNNTADISFLGKGFYIMNINMNGVEVIKKLIVM